MLGGSFSSWQRVGHYCPNLGNGFSLPAQVEVGYFCICMVRLDILPAIVVIARVTSPITAPLRGMN
jgi:hypothetical protein